MDTKLFDEDEVEVLLVDAYRMGHKRGLQRGLLITSILSAIIIANIILFMVIK